jgi:MFS family permease
VVGPFYLSGALALDAARVGLVMSSGPIVAALVGVPAGRLVDRFGAQRTSVLGLLGMLAGCAALPLVAAGAGAGVAGYVVPLVLLTAGYALFQAANNTAVMTTVPAEQRGVIAGLLSLSRNLGLVTGAAVMGAVFAFGAATATANAAAAAGPLAMVAGMRLTFGVAAVLIAGALAVALLSQALARRAAAA